MLELSPATIKRHRTTARVWHLPVFQHGEGDVGAFRLFTSQMIVNGTVKPKDIVRAFGVPMVTVKRYFKVMRERGSEGFYVRQARHSSASVLKEKSWNERSSCWTRDEAYRKSPGN